MTRVFVLLIVLYVSDVVSSPSWISLGLDTVCFCSVFIVLYVSRVESMLANRVRVPPPAQVLTCTTQRTTVVPAGSLMCVQHPHRSVLVPSLVSDSMSPSEGVLVSGKLRRLGSFRSWTFCVVLACYTGAGGSLTSFRTQWSTWDDLRRRHKSSPIAISVCYVLVVSVLYRGLEFLHIAGPPPCAFALTTPNHPTSILTRRHKKHDLSQEPLEEVYDGTQDTYPPLRDACSATTRDVRLVCSLQISIVV